VNDVFVSYKKPCDQSSKAVHDIADVDLYDILIKQSHQTVKEVYNNPKQFNGKYVCRLECISAKEKYHASVAICDNQTLAECVT